jgi:hypothetical protein
MITMSMTAVMGCDVYHSASILGSGWWYKVSPMVVASADVSSIRKPRLHTTASIFSTITGRVFHMPKVMLLRPEP